jgi:MFS transporter, DHA1 family, multidrug resistance protein
MFDALGVGGGGSLIGGVATLLAPIPFVFYKYGATIRNRSKFAPTEDDNDEREKSREEEPRSDSSSTLDDQSSHTAELDDRDADTLDGVPRFEDLDKDLEKGIFESIGGLGC